MTTSPVQAVVAEMRDEARILRESKPVSPALADLVPSAIAGTLERFANRLESAQAAGAGNPAFVGEWHRRAVELGYDGVSELIAFALPCIVNSGGDERPTPVAADAGLSEGERELRELESEIRSVAGVIANGAQDINGWADRLAALRRLGARGVDGAMVERMARWLAVQDNIDPDATDTRYVNGIDESWPEWRNYEDDARAALSAALARPEGGK